MSLDASDLDQYMGVPMEPGELKEPVAVNDIRRWVQGMHYPNPLHYDDAWAEESRFGAIVAPQSFTVACDTSHGCSPAQVGKIPNSHLIFGGDDWWFFGPRVWPGDKLVCHRMPYDYKVTDTKFAGPTCFQRGDTLYISQRGERVALQRSTAIRYQVKEAKEKKLFSEPQEPEWTDDQLEELEKQKLEFIDQIQTLRHDKRLFGSVEVGDRLATNVLGPHSLASFTTEWRAYPMTTWGAMAKGPTTVRAEALGYTKEMAGFEGDRRMERVNPELTDGAYYGPSRGHLQPRWAKHVGMPRGYGYGASMGAWILDYVAAWAGEWGFLIHSSAQYRNPAFTGDATFITGEVVGTRVERKRSHLVTVKVELRNQDDAVMAKATVDAELQPNSQAVAGRGEVARYGAFPVVALASTLMLEQGERLSLAQAFDGIKADFGVSDTALGFLAAAMVVVGVAGGIPIGVLADRWRRTTLLVIAMVIWTVCMGLGAIAPGFVFLLVTRLGVGIVEANGPASFSLMADYYPVGLRARMLGRYQLGGAAGGLVGIGLSGVLVDIYGWRAAFWMWIPFGLLVVFIMTRLPEPERGVQDFAYHVEATTDLDVGAVADVGVGRTSSIDYAQARWPEVIRELLHIRSMWFAVMALTISGFLLNALGAWGVEFFKRAHDLSATEASAFVPAIGGGAAIGLVGGGALADRLLHRGIVNARVYVTAIASVVAAVLLVPAFLSGSLAASAVLLFFGSLALTTPVAPTEALLSDVVPGELRGRAASVRAVVRALSALSPFIVGVISDATDLQTALAVVTPLYGVGGLVMLLAAKTYPADLAFVAAEARRTLAVPDTSVRK